MDEGVRSEAGARGGKEGCGLGACAGPSAGLHPRFPPRETTAAAQRDGTGDGDLAIRYDDDTTTIRRRRNETSMARPKRNETSFFAFPEVQLAYAFPPMVSDEEAGRRIKAIVRALVSRERGVDELADAAMDIRDAYYQQRRDAIAARWGRRDATPPLPGTEGYGVSKNDTPYPKRDKTDTYIPTDKTDKTDKTSTPTPVPPPSPPQVGRTETGGRTDGSGKKPGGGKSRGQHPVFDGDEWRARFGDDKYGSIMGLAAPLLVEFVLHYCGELGNTRAQRTYSRVRMEHPEAFRQLVLDFVGEVESGEEPESRGRAFMARAKQLEART